MKRGILGLTLATALFALVGCAEKFTHERFQTIRQGDESAHVERTLGAPETRMEGVWFYRNWKTDQSARIMFDGEGRVVNKEWVNGSTGEWEGHDKAIDK